MAMRGRMKKVLSIGLGVLIGAVIGALFSKLLLASKPRASVGAEIFWPLLLLALATWSQIILHEAGHLVFGLLTGYRFCSFRIGSLMLYRGADGLRFGRFSLPGTGGQCLLAPPTEDIADAERLPVLLYNLGGCIVNVALSMIAAIAAWGVLNALSWGALFLKAFSMTGLFFALLNGIPLKFEMVSNDGRNARDLAKSASARRAFWQQLTVNAHQTMGERLRDMPEAWFDAPDSFVGADALVSSLGVNRLARAVDAGDDAATERIGSRLLREAARLHGLHRYTVRSELLCLALLRGETPNGAESAELRRFWKQTGRLISSRRMQVAAALLIDGDEVVAWRAREAFERTARRYPFAGDLACERALLERIERAYREKRA